MRCLKLLSLAMVAASLLVAGCSSNNKGKIEGTRWRSDEIKEGKTITSPMGAKQLEFRQDGTMTFGEGGQSSFGTYSLGSGDSVTFTLKKEVGGSKSPAKKIIINDDKLTLIKSDDTEELYSKAGTVQ
jgi:hypothetical protein